MRRLRRSLCLLMLLSALMCSATAEDTAPHLLWDMPFGLPAAELTAQVEATGAMTVIPPREKSDYLVFTAQEDATYLGYPLRVAYASLLAGQGGYSALTLYWHAPLAVGYLPSEPLASSPLAAFAQRCTAMLEALAKDCGEPEEIRLAVETLARQPKEILPVADWRQDVTPELLFDALPNAMQARYHARLGNVLFQATLVRHNDIYGAEYLVRYGDAALPPLAEVAGWAK